ncbi:hypothetical protein BT96DRAFT_1009322 [Gymnopus androsaceus JB14]|uniref:Uncharacterized protein n=1 Tax=Gymnopus androsaceus JB14 TaxID=1447944 RepID=A0A6A4GCT8_9AGAR|nr:hypothetical protein BT96DRAFT_1009322 [Gymnopus androsaceus JB14]
MKFQEKYAPEHVKRELSYEEHREAVIREGWAPEMVDKIILERREQRQYYCKIMYGREYYQKNKDLLLARTSIRNQRRAQSLSQSSSEVQELAKERHRQAQARYRKRNGVLLAQKEKFRRARQ